MKILLTGDSGFVGQYVKQHVKQHIDIVLLRDANGNKNGNRIDLCDENKLYSFIALHAIDHVIHLAAQSHVPTSFEDPKRTFEVNFFGTFNLLNALKKAGFKGKFLYVGSSEVYGLVKEEELPIIESQLLKPRNPYAVSKVSAEALCYQWSLSEQFDIVMARPFNHIGPFQSDRFVVSSFAKQIMQIKLKIQEPVIDVGDIYVTRDFTDVRDVVDAYLLLLEKGENSEVYNVCTGVEHSLECILKELLKIAQVDASIGTSKNLMRPSEQRRMRGSFQKLKDHTGWSPKIPFHKTLQDILNGWEKTLCQKEH
ncbi:MAG: GDP-mannose 4,6-dehydratase [Chlamydiales bacterium]|nr:GDP-mannose 4,6-dehydratase [Chlamydiales bacterium]